MKDIESKLKEHDFKLIAAPLIVYVEGSFRKNEWALKIGELEKVKRWAEELTKAFTKQNS